MELENIEFGKRIRTLREYQKLSREKLAENSNISTQFLADIENGKKGMSALTLKKICSALHVTADSIVFGSSCSNDSSKITEMLAVIPQEKRENFEEIIQKIIKLI